MPRYCGHKGGREGGKGTQGDKEGQENDRVADVAHPTKGQSDASATYLLDVAFDAGEDAANEAKGLAVAQRLLAGLPEPAHHLLLRRQLRLRLQPKRVRPSKEARVGATFQTT